MTRRLVRRCHPLCDREKQILDIARKMQFFVFGYVGAATESRKTCPRRLPHPRFQTLRRTP